MLSYYVFYWPPNYDSDLFLYTYISQFLLSIFCINLVFKIYPICKICSESDIRLSNHRLVIRCFNQTLNEIKTIGQSFQIIFRSYLLLIPQQSWWHLDSMTLSSFSNISLKLFYPYWQLNMSYYCHAKLYVVRLCQIPDLITMSGKSNGKIIMISSIPSTLS